MMAKAGLDFTCGNRLGMTIAGGPFPHLPFELVLIASTWVWACVVMSSCCEALINGLQRGLWELERRPV